MRNRCTSTRAKEDDMNSGPDRSLLIGVAVAVLLVLAACDGGDEAPRTDESPASVPEGAAEEVATAFLQAYGALDVNEARTYLADDAVIMSMGANDDLRLLISYLEATGYQQVLDPSEAVSSSPSGTSVRCSFDFHALRSGEIGLGPYTGSTFLLTVRDGEVARASQDWAIEDFSPQVWEPFAEWVFTAYPQDAAVMYLDGGSNVRLTKESIRLWGQHTREYVREVAR
jgi:hypothetical protein